jgi:hypothetical protein
MSYSSGLNPDVIKTKLDKVFFQEFNGSQHPGHATAETSQLFKQDTADSAAEIVEIFKGVGEWEETNEEQNLPQGNPRINNEQTFSVSKYAKSVHIPKEFFDDSKHGSYSMMIQNFGRRARTTRDKNAMAVWNGAFATYKTADDAYIVSDSHTNLNGDTVDNKSTAALSPTALKDGIKELYEQKAQDGEIDGHLANCLIVAPDKFDYATEIVNSELKADSGDNNMNPYSQTYNLWVFTSPYLGAAAGGDDNAWFLVSETHNMTRWVREGVSTNLIDYSISDNDVYKYKGRYREMVGCPTYEGIYGSDGNA